MAERLPGEHGDSRITFHNGQYHLVVTMPAQQYLGETQARVVALDPGIRNFLAWFSATDAGHIAPGAFGKIQRLCAHLDDLLSRARLEKKKFAKRNKYRAAARMRVRISNLMDELHHQAARWLVDHFDIILLPTFETSEMVLRGARKLRAKSFRSMLTYAIPVPAFPQVEVQADRQTVAAGQRGIHHQNLQLERRNYRQLGRTQGDNTFGRNHNGPGHQRRSRDIHAGFERYTCPARRRAGAHRRLRYCHC